MALSKRDEDEFNSIVSSMVASDPSFGKTGSGKPSIVGATVGVCVGVMLLVAGVIVDTVWVGVLGFLVALAGVCIRWRGRSGVPGRRLRQKRSLTDVASARWQRRQQGTDT